MLRVTSRSDRRSRPDLKAKVVFVGKSGVGKTSIILRHDGQGFFSKVSPTLGASFITSEFIVNGKNIELQMWDTAGQERYFSMLPMYLRNAVAAIVVYDITDRESFIELKKWINEVERHVNAPTSFFIVGNKLDLENARSVSEQEAAQYAEQIGATFFETSALNGDGIRRVIIAVANHLLERQLDQQRPPAISLDGDGVTDQQRKYRKFCCTS